jgi:hypothetical protein
MYSKLAVGEKDASKQADSRRSPLGVNLAFDRPVQVPSTSRPRQLLGYRAGLLKLAMSLRLSDLVARRIDMPLETFVLFATIAMPLALSLGGLPLHLQAVSSEQAIIALLAAATAALASNLWRTAQGAFRAAALLCWPSGAVDKLFHRSVVVEAAKCSVGTLSSSLLFTARSTQFRRQICHGKARVGAHKEQGPQMSGSRKSFSVFCKLACVPTSTLCAAETCFCLDKRKSDTRAGWAWTGLGRDGQTPDLPPSGFCKAYTLSRGAAASRLSCRVSPFWVRRLSRDFWLMGSY